MAYPQFVQGGQLTPEGRKLQEFIEAQYAPFNGQGTEVNLAGLNSLSGPIAEYYSIVGMMHSKTPANWMETMPHSANNAYDIMKYVEDKVLKEAQTANQLNENTEAVTKISAELTKLKESVSEQVAELEKAIADRDAQIEALKKSRGGRPRKDVTEPTAETETETAPESE